MKLKILTASMILAFIASQAVAETTDEVTTPDDEGQSYLGLAAGPLIIGGGIPFNDDGVMLTILYGYDLPNNNFAIEGEFGTTVSKSSSDVQSYGDLGVTTLGGYFVYRTPNRVYFTAKIGLLYKYLTSSVTGGNITVDVDGPGMFIPIGIGGGVRITERLDAEIEYTMIDPDIGYASLGLNWAF